MSTRASTDVEIRAVFAALPPRHAEALLYMAETHLAPPSPPLTPEQIARINRELADRTTPRIPHEEVMRRFGIPPDRRSEDEIRASVNDRLEETLRSLSDDRAVELLNWLVVPEPSGLH